MKRIMLLSLLLSLGLAFALLSPAVPRVAAQEASPMAGAVADAPIELAPGFIAEVFASAPYSRTCESTPPFRPVHPSG